MKEETQANESSNTITTTRTQYSIEIANPPIVWMTPIGIYYVYIDSYRNTHQIIIFHFHSITRHRHNHTHCAMLYTLFNLLLQH